MSSRKVLSTPGTRAIALTTVREILLARLSTRTLPEPTCDARFAASAGSAVFRFHGNGAAPPGRNTSSTVLNDSHTVVLGVPNFAFRLGMPRPFGSTGQLR